MHTIGAFTLASEEHNYARYSPGEIWQAAHHRHTAHHRREAAFAATADAETRHEVASVRDAATTMETGERSAIPETAPPSSSAIAHAVDDARGRHGGEDGVTAAEVATTSLSNRKHRRPMPTVPNSAPRTL